MGPPGEPNEPEDAPENAPRPGGLPRRPGRVRVLVLRSGALGDFVLTLPVLDELRRIFGGAELVLVSRDGFGRLALAASSGRCSRPDRAASSGRCSRPDRAASSGRCPGPERACRLADLVVSEDSREVAGLYSRLAASGRCFRERHGPFDVAVSFVISPEVRRNLLAAGVGEVHSRTPRPLGPSGLHAADHLLSVTRGLGRPPVPAIPALALDEEHRARAGAVLRGEGLEAGTYLAVHPGSGSPKKNWPLGRYAGLARRAREEAGLKVLVLTGPAEEESRPAIEDALAGAADALLHGLDLVTLAGVLASSAAYVGNDSGVTHLAAAAGAKVVAVFGPTDPAVWGPRGEGARVVRSGSGSLEAVGVDEVLKLVLDGEHGRSGGGRS